MLKLHSCSTPMASGDPQISESMYSASCQPELVISLVISRKQCAFRCWFKLRCAGVDVLRHQLM